MRIYTVYEASDVVSSVIPIKEGFNWAAVFFSLLWAMYYRLWGWAVFIALANGFLIWVLFFLRGDFVVQTTAFMALAVIIGWSSNDVKRKSLIKRGFKEAAVLLADGKKTAIARYGVMVGDRMGNAPHNRAGGPW